MTFWRTRPRRWLLSCPLRRRRVSSNLADRLALFGGPGSNCQSAAGGRASTQTGTDGSQQQESCGHEQRDSNGGAGQLRGSKKVRQQFTAGICLCPARSCPPQIGRRQRNPRRHRAECLCKFAERSQTRGEPRTQGGERGPFWSAASQ